MIKIRLYIVLFFLGACKPGADQGVLQSHAQLPIERHYQEAVKQGHLRSALLMTCNRFGLEGCEAMNIVEEDNPLHKAVTSQAWLGNGITLYLNAFQFRGVSHMGWLAAIIRHEQVHQKQSGYLRWVQGVQSRVLQNYSYVAQLEIEAWNKMLDYEVEYDLNCHQVMEIEENLYQFHRVLRNKGANIEDQKTLPMDQYRQLMLQCLERKQAHRDTH